MVAFLGCWCFAIAKHLCETKEVSPEGREEDNRAFVKRGGGGARNMVRGILPRSRLVQHLPTHRQTMTIPSPSEPSPSEIR